MNNKGFTLMEIIIVIALLATLSVVMGLNMTNTMKNQKEKEKEEYKEKITNAACVYADLDDTCRNNGSCLISISTLIENGLLDKTIVNPYSSNKETVEKDTHKVKFSKKNNAKVCEYVE